MSLCINPNCLQPDHPGNDGSRFCQSCGSDLVLQERYRVMRLLSDKSGFGRVYEAYERSIPKILKVLKETHSKTSKAVFLFKREALVLSQLKHPGIPAVEADGYFEFTPRGTEEPLHCIIMEKIDGPNLREWMRQQGNNPISEKQAINWMRQVTDVLHRVHQKNFFHRDIKPENIMLRSNGQLVLVDFGAVREMTDTYLAQLGVTGGVTRISSAGYTPPEQEKGQAVPQSDFYALGWTFVFLLTGKLPTDPEIYDSLHNSYHWRRYAPQISSAFADFIDRLIAERAADRPRTTQEMLDTLEKLAIAPTPAPALGSATRSQPDTHSPPRETVLQADTAVQARRTTAGAGRQSHRWLLGGLALLILGLAGYGAVRIYGCWSQGDCVIFTGDRPQTLLPAKILAGHAGLVNRVAFASNGQTVISAGLDSTIRLWDVATGNPIRTLSGHTGFINALTVSDDGKLLASGGSDKEIKIWDMATGQLLQTLKGHTQPINALLFTPDGVLVSGSADRTIRLWNPTSGQMLRLLEGHKGFINTLAISPDGQTLASGGTDPVIMTWNLQTGEHLRSFDGFTGFINAIAFTHDGMTLIGGGTDRSIHLWDLSNGTLKQTLTDHLGFINNLAVRGDGQIFLSSDAEGKLVAWDLQHGRAIASFIGEGALLDHFAISPDWRTLATGRGFDAVRLWALPPIQPK